MKLLKDILREVGLAIALVFYSSEEFSKTSLVELCAAKDMVHYISYDSSDACDRNPT